MLPPRKQIKHYPAQGEARELTFSCYQRAPVFATSAHCTLLTTQINRALAATEFDLLAFVYMPEHVHLLLMPRNDGQDISAFLWHIKRRSAMAIRTRLEATNDIALLEKLQYSDPRGARSFRLWQAGPGYDRNVNQPTTLAKMVDYIHHNPVRRGLCASPSDYLWSSWRQLHAPGEYDNSDVPKVHWPDGLTL